MGAAGRPQFLPLTAEVRAALEAVRQAEDTYVRGRDSSSILDLAKLALADVVLATRPVQGSKHRQGRRPGHRGMSLQLRGSYA